MDDKNEKKSVTFTTDSSNYSNLYFAILKTEDSEYVKILRKLYSLLSVNDASKIDANEVKRNIELFDEKYAQYIPEDILSIKNSDIVKNKVSFEMEKNNDSFYSFFFLMIMT